MKKLGIVLIGTATSFLLLNLFSQEFAYVGAAKCKICHRTAKQGEQYPKWESSKHSKSFQALSTDQAKEIAEQAGIQNPAENAKCLQCHGPLFDKASEFKQEGVTCEVCHGPGSAYKKLSIMKDREESAKNGLILYGSPDEIKKQCLICHENAHDKPFDFAAAWEKVKHPKPEDE
jgi:hypothetical protein